MTAPPSSMPVSPHLASTRIMLLLAAMAALDTMAIDLYSSAFPTIAADFSVTSEAISATLSIFLLGASVGQLVLGPLLDRFGRKWPLVGGMAIFTLGSLICTVAPNYPVFLCGRLVQALGASASLVGPRVVIADIYQAKDMARALSIIMQIMMIAPVISPVMGALILTHFGWRANFMLLTTLAVLLTAAMAWLMPETLPVDKRTSASPSAIFGAYSAALSRVHFVWLMMAASCISAALYTFLSASPFAFIDGFGISAIQYSIILGVISIAMTATGGVNIYLLPKLGEERLLMIGLWTLFLSALALVLLIWAQQAGFWTYTILASINMSALGLIFGNVNSLAMQHAGIHAGVGSAALGIAQSLISASAGLLLILTGTDKLGMMSAITLFAAGALAAKKLGDRSDGGPARVQESPR